MTEPPTDAPPPPPPRPGEPAPPDGPREEPPRCHRCGAPHDRFQEYCLECGARLARPPVRSAAVWRRETWSRDSPVWFWATFLALLLVALAAGAIVLAATRDDAEREAEPATAGPTTSVIVAPTEPVETETVPDTLTVPNGANAVPTLPTETDGAMTPPAPAPPPPPPAAGNGNVISWPANQSGYTVILASIQESRGRGPADAKAQEAIANGLSEVGVLNSSDFSSLNAGYWVTFTGIHDTENEARSALASVRQSGYPIAYIREITP